ncbi:MAG: DUF2065 domain-containing protein [Mariprofundus sp.]|nr:DUF2065 domain-containing protein [Mariprofundus sp.]
MDDLFAAVGLVMVLEGAIYALFPTAMIDAMRKLPEIPPQVIRLSGLVALAIGWLIVKWVRG